MCILRAQIHSHASTSFSVILYVYQMFEPIALFNIRRLHNRRPCFVLDSYLSHSHTSINTAYAVTTTAAAAAAASIVHARKHTHERKYIVHANISTFMCYRVPATPRMTMCIVLS